MSQKILFKLMHWVSVFRLMFELIKYMDLIYIYIHACISIQRVVTRNRTSISAGTKIFRSLSTNQNGLQYKFDSLTQYYSKNQSIWPAYILSSPFTSSLSIFLTQLQVSKFYPFPPNKTLRPFIQHRLVKYVQKL